MIALSLGLLAALCWSISDLIARKLGPEIGSARMSAIAMGLAFLVMAFSAAASPQTYLATWGDWAWLGLVGAIYGIAVASLYKAFSLAPVSIVGPLTAGYPALIVIWNMMNGFRPSLLQTAGVAAVLIGSIVVGRFAAQDETDNNVASGRFGLVIGLCVLSSLCFAAPLVMAKASSVVFGEFNTAGLMHLPAALVLVPLAWNEKAENLKLRGSVGLALMVIGVLDITALSGINLMNGLPNKELGPMGISAYGGIAVLLAMIFLKEKVAPAQWIGIALIVLGVAGLGVQAG